MGLVKNVTKFSEHRLPCNKKNRFWTSRYFIHCKEGQFKTISLSPLNNLIAFLFSCIPISMYSKKLQK